MKKALIFILPLLIVAIIAICAAVTAAPVKRPKLDIGHLVIASWNVENLFDAADDPDNEGDDDYTPWGWTRWTESRYRMKLTNLTEIISEMAPDVLVLEEVENRRVLDDLCEILENVRKYPMDHIIHRDSTDFRGIDVAMLSRLKPEQVAWIESEPGLRDSPMAEFVVKGKKLFVIGNHWKSHYIATGSTKEESDQMRERMASRVRDGYRALLREDPTAAILVTGDFNDNLDDPAPAAAGFSLDLEEVLSSGTNLFCLSSLLPKNRKSRGTFYYSRDKIWNSFDTINVSRGLLTSDSSLASPWVVQTNSYEIYATPKQRHGTNGPSYKADAPYPFRRSRVGKGWRFSNGYSDHFPVRVVIQAR